MFPLRFRRTGLPAAGILVVSLLVASPAAPAAADRWETTIEAFERQDRLHPPPQHAIEFIGSSSIVKWDLHRYFPHRKVINRGFGGSEIADSVRYAPRILIPYRPRIVVLYAGDNDIAAGKSPEQVLADFQAFVAEVHRALPETRIVFIAIKPSLRRWNLVGKMRRANRLIRRVIERDPRLDYVDIDRPMIGSNGKPRPELFAPDGLHLSPAGYRLWTSLLLPYLQN